MGMMWARTGCRVKSSPRAIITSSRRRVRAKRIRRRHKMRFMRFQFPRARPLKVPEADSTRCRGEVTSIAIDPQLEIPDMRKTQVGRQNHELNCRKQKACMKAAGAWREPAARVAHAGGLNRRCSR